MRTERIVLDLNEDTSPTWEPFYILPTAAPTNGAEGSFYFDSTAHAPYFYDDAGYVQIATLGNAQTFAENVTIATSKTLAVTTADKLTVGGNIIANTIPLPVRCLLNADCIDQHVFLADRAYQVTAITEIHDVAGNDAGAVNLQVTKDTGTAAPGAGNNLLTNNTNAGFDLKGTARTLQTGTLTATTADLQLAAGDRLSLDFAGTVTTLAGVLVTIVLKAI